MGKETEKILTISIAAYNVEKYIDQTLNSIFDNEGLSDDLKSRLEILVINDGSTDQTAILAMKYAEKYPGIVKIINKQNGGHGSTINLGIQMACGKYFKPLDGDDWIDGQGLLRVLKQLGNTDVDMVVTDYTKCYKDGTFSREHIDGINIMEGKKYDLDKVIDNIPWIAYHATIFKTSILQGNNIRIDENCFYVDTEFQIYSMLYIQTMMYLKCNLYCYRLGLEHQSVSREGRKQHLSDEKKVADSLLDTFQKEMRGLSSSRRRYIIKGIGGHCVWHYCSLLLLKPEKNIKSEIIAFDEQIKNISEEVCNYMEQVSVLVRLMRKSNYRLYYLIGFYRRLKWE